MPPPSPHAVLTTPTTNQRSFYYHKVLVSAKCAFRFVHKSPVHHPLPPHSRLYICERERLKCPVQAQQLPLCHAVLSGLRQKRAVFFPLSFFPFDEGGSVHFCVQVPPTPPPQPFFEAAIAFVCLLETGVDGRRGASDMAPVQA